MVLGVNVYEVTFLASLIMLALLLVVAHKQNITYYLLIFLMVIICNMGHYTLSMAKTLDTALMGQKLIYLGCVFVPIFFLLATFRLCHLDPPTWLVAVLSSLTALVLFSAFSIGESGVYYKSVYIARENGISYLVKEYGPMHQGFIILIFGVVFITIGVILYSFYADKNVPYKVMFYILVIAVITISCYVLKRIFPSKIDWTSAIYVVDEILFLALIRRIGRYEIMESVADSLEDQNTHGYIAFDKKGCYVSSNHMAKVYLPELENQRVDEPLSPEYTPVLYEKFSKILYKAIIREEKCLIELNERVLRCTLKELHLGKRKKVSGYLIEVIDDTQNLKYLSLLNNYNEDLEKEVAQKTAYVNILQERMVLGMADIVETRDTNTGGHVKRTSDVVRIIADELYAGENVKGVTNEFLVDVIKAAPMHDLGKLAVDDRILRKPGKFTPEEFDEMKKHSEKGAEIVANILNGVEDESLIKIATNIAHYHHEKWNGEGYPCRLAGEEIPFEARIMALADVFDALVSKRCYKEKMDYDQAFAIIEESLGSHFDPEIGRVFLNCRPQLEAYYDGVGE